MLTNHRLCLIIITVVTENSTLELQITSQLYSTGFIADKTGSFALTEFLASDYVQIISMNVVGALPSATSTNKGGHYFSYFII